MSEYITPVMYTDPSGYFLISTAIAIGFWIGLSIGAIVGGTVLGIFAYNEAKESGATGWGVGAIWGTAPIAGSNGAIALWSGGQGAAYNAAAGYAASTGANLVTQTFAGRTLVFASHFLPKVVSNFLWGQLSAEFVGGAASATIFLYGTGIAG